MTQEKENQLKNTLDSLYKLFKDRPDDSDGDDTEAEAFGALVGKLRIEAHDLGASWLDIEMTIMFALNQEERKIRIAVTEDEPGSEHKRDLTVDEIDLIKKRFKID